MLFSYRKSLLFFFFLTFLSAISAAPSNPGLHKPHASQSLTTSEEAVEAALADPSQEWDRVQEDPDFLLMNGDEETLHRLQMNRHRRRQRENERMQKRLEMQRLNAQDQEDIFIDAILSGKPIYVEQQSKRSIDHNVNKRQLFKRGKLLRLSLTNNIDVLREKLFMEIARRERMMNDQQIAAAQTGLGELG